MLACVLAVIIVLPAEAFTTPAMLGVNGTPGTASNTGAVSGNAASYPAHTFSTGGATVSCADANFTVTTITTTSLSVDPAYSGCALLISGTPVSAATVDSPCTWHLYFGAGIFNTVTGVTQNVILTTTCTTTFTAEAVGCTIHVPAQTKIGISTQNIDATGFPTSAAVPWGMKIIGNMSGMTTTTTGTCPGVAEHGDTGHLGGTVALRNVYGTP